MDRAEAAESLFAEGFACSQAVLGAFCEPLGLDRTTATRLAAGFGGGMGRTANVCGAVSGAIMALGLKFGGGGDPRHARETVYAKVRDFLGRFEADEGSILCRALLGCDIGTEEGYRRAREEDLFRTVCPRYVRRAAVIVDELLQSP